MANRVERTAMFIKAVHVKPGNFVTFDYTNYKDEKSHRRVQVLDIIWGATEWHPDKQFLLLGTDLDKGEDRAFAMLEIVV